MKRRCPARGLLHHTNQGSPYASEDDQRVLDTNGIVCSMSRRGNRYNDAAMETFFGTFKTEVSEHFESAAAIEGAGFRLRRALLQPRAAAFSPGPPMPGRP